MTLGNILEKTAELVGADLSETADRELLTRCTVFTVTRISGEFTDLKTKQRVVSESGRIDYGQFGKPLKKVIKVVKDREKRPFSEESDGIKVGFNGEADVTYAYYAETAESGGTVDLPPKFGVYVVALGAAGEFCYRRGLLKEADVYDRRFKAALENVLCDSKSVTLKAVRV